MISQGVKLSSLKILGVLPKASSFSRRRQVIRVCFGQLRTGCLDDEVRAQCERSRWFMTTSASQPFSRTTARIWPDCGGILGLTQTSRGHGAGSVESDELPAPCSELPAIHGGRASHAISVCRPPAEFRGGRATCTLHHYGEEFKCCFRPPLAGGGGRELGLDEGIKRGAFTLLVRY